EPHRGKRPIDRTPAPVVPCTLLDGGFMRAHRSASALIWLLLAALGCAGDGCGGCMEPIPGGFPPEERASNAITTKLTKDGLDQIQGLVSDMIVQQLGATTLDLPCTVQRMT